MLGPKTIDNVFLMYSFNNVGYIFLIINSILPEMNAGTIMRCIDATFLYSGFLRKKIHLALLAMNFLYLKYLNR
jgi:hypothetical protein